MEHGKTIFMQLCYTCHGADGKGTPIPDNPKQTLAPSMVKASRIIGGGSTMVRTILHGLTGPLDGKTYPGVMAPMNSQDDQWIADVATYVRNSFGNKAAPDYTGIRGCDSQGIGGPDHTVDAGGTGSARSPGPGEPKSVEAHCESQPGRLPKGDRWQPEEPVGDRDLAARRGVVPNRIAEGRESERTHPRCPGLGSRLSSWL